MIGLQEIGNYINLGRWYLKLVLLLSLPLVAYVIRCKWRFAVAKEAEIKRLMLLAADEAGRAEREAAHAGYYGQIGVHCRGADEVGFEDDEEVEVKKKKKGFQEVGGGGGMKVHQCAVCRSPTTRGVSGARRHGIGTF